MIQYDRFSKGFNLIELIVVIAIIGILAGAITPAISRYLPSVQLNGSARVLATNLREAQEKTITEQKQYLVRFRLTDLPPSYDLIRLESGSEELQKNISLASDETILLDNAITNNQIVFSPDGGPSSSGNITLSINDAHKIISISPAGFINIQ